MRKPLIHGRCRPIPGREAHGEEGVAMIAAVIAALIVAGVVVVFSMFISSQNQQSRSERQRTESLYWVEAAAAQVQSQLQAFGIDADKVTTGTSAMAFWRVAGSGTRSIVIPGSSVSGSFQVLPPVPGAPPDTVAFNRNPADLAHRGEVTLLLRGWSAQAKDPRPRDVRVTFRRSTLASYSVISDDPIDLSAFGSARVSGAIHSNNVANAPVAITTGNAAISSPEVTTTQGAISGPCPGWCRADIQRTVSFTSVDELFHHVDATLASLGCAREIVCAVSDTWSVPAGRSPIYSVGLSGSCVSVTHASVALRQDAGTAPIVDDAVSPVAAGSGSSYCASNPRGGLALVFNGDVQVSGTRPAGAVPITILARNTWKPTVVVNGVAVQRSQPASIFLQGPVIGTNDLNTALGLVAEGSVYLPSWGLVASAANRNLLLRNTALVAKEGEFGLGPATLAMAGATTAGTSAGGGLDPCAPEAAPYRSPAGSRVTLIGSIATRRAPILRYGSATCRFGYELRTYGYAPALAWNPPPMFPTQHAWHETGWSELAQERP